MEGLLASLRVRSRNVRFCSLPALEHRGVGKISRLPVSIRILLESVARHIDGHKIREEDVLHLARWQSNAKREAEVPFVVGRVLLQDFTGVPLLVDLAAMRSEAHRRGADVERIQPRVPVDLVVDHSVQVDHFGHAEALQRNTELEFHRNRERYAFLKWAEQAFENHRIVPPEFGICHQVNLEYLAKVVLEQGDVLYPDSLVGSDSHTTMVNGLGVMGWGVGGIEAEAAMLGQPVYLLLPDVIGVHLHGQLAPGVTATDLVLRVTERLREMNVVGKFVEFHGQGAARLTVPDRATIANMAPEYGATIGFFPVDEQTCSYLSATGRSEDHVEAVRRYYQAQAMFGMPEAGQCEYTHVVDLDLSTIAPSISGPSRPQDRIPLSTVKRHFMALLTSPTGYGKRPSEIARPVPLPLSQSQAAPRTGGGLQWEDSIPDGQLKNTNTLTEMEMMNNRPTANASTPPLARPHTAAPLALRHGDVVIAAITSCTNTSNPTVMLTAGLLAKAAVERGLSVKPWVKTSLAPGSRVVSRYLDETALQPFLDKLGFQTVGFGCTTCIGNSGPLDADIEEAIARYQLVVCSVLSGNRNFEARIHQSVKANFLMSPPLVVAYALSGRIDIDWAEEPIGTDGGQDVFLRDLWPPMKEVEKRLPHAFDPAAYQHVYANFASPLWQRIPTAQGLRYEWDPASLYIREPPYFGGTMGAAAFPVKNARVLALFGDSITTDHISPAGAIKPSGPAGTYLREHNVDALDFNSYGSRRGNHEVMVRGTFANVRIRNLMTPGTEGGVTLHQPDGARMSIYEAAQCYRDEGTPLVVIGGREYGTGSSRDSAAKGTRLLGVRAVIARSFERIHRSNLIGMGVLPCQFLDGTSAQTLGLDGTESFDLLPIGAIRPGGAIELCIRRKDGEQITVPLLTRIDTPIEAEYFAAGGILPYMLNQLLAVGADGQVRTAGINRLAPRR